jgi:hypothetical protein
MTADRGHTCSSRPEPKQRITAFLVPHLHSKQSEGVHVFTEDIFTDNYYISSVSQYERDLYYSVTFLHQLR